MDVVHGVVSLRRQVKVGEQGEHLCQHRSLAPHPTGVDLEAMKQRPHRGFKFALKASQILARHPAVVVAMVVGDGGRKVALVKRVSSRLEPDLTSTLGRSRPFFIHHVLQRPCQVGLHEMLALVWHPAIGKIDLRIGCPQPVTSLIRLNVVTHHGMHRETVSRITNGCVSDFTERARAKTR